VLTCASQPSLNLTTPTDIDSSTQPYLDLIFPDTKTTPTQSAPSDITGAAFLSDRSLSLWQQLLQPPPMAPPNWTRSRIRRLFLVQAETSHSAQHQPFIHRITPSQHGYRSSQTGVSKQQYYVGRLKGSREVQAEAPYHAERTTATTGL
jgi:hypothetical protein